MSIRYCNILCYLLVTFFIFSACSTNSDNQNNNKELGAQELFEMGIKSAKFRKFEEAISYYDAAIAKDKNFSDAYFRRGLAKDNLGKTLDAIADYTTAIEIEPRPIYFNNRGIDKAILGEYEEALLDYNEAILLDEYYGDAFINRGYALAELGRIDEACFDFRRALELKHVMAQQMIDHYCN